LQILKKNVENQECPIQRAVTDIEEYVAESGELEDLQD
jgi:hypothetical protein